MAEIIKLPAACGAVQEPVSMLDWLRQRLARLHWRRNRIGNADELPDRLRRDMGLAAQVPGRHYRDYLSSNGW